MGKSVNKKFSYGELSRLVLDKLADCLIATRMLNRPNIYFALGKIIKLILKETKVEKSRINRIFSRLKDRRLIYLKEKNNQVYVYLKEKGRIKVIKRSLKLLLDFKKKKKKWDGRWFLVFFDVPEIQRSKRNYLRSFLKKLGFYPYQQSVYIFPYECEKEVALIKKIVEGAKYMKYIIAEKIEDEAPVKRFFGLK